MAKPSQSPPPSEPKQPELKFRTKPVQERSLAQSWAVPCACLLDHNAPPPSHGQAAIPAYASSGIGDRDGALSKSSPNGFSVPAPVLSPARPFLHFPMKDRSAPASYRIPHSAFSQSGTISSSSAAPRRRRAQRRTARVQWSKKTAARSTPATATNEITATPITFHSFGPADAADAAAGDADADAAVVVDVVDAGAVLAAGGAGVGGAVGVGAGPGVPMTENAVPVGSAVDPEPELVRVALALVLGPSSALSTVESRGSASEPGGVRVCGSCSRGALRARWGRRRG
ncbi:uncharacterized protein BXZ73DRAFT_101411 [Epithele typhae]|uniref:uncharacterized protein n=1 Tax=Epithele typhae TaxID=378194 RepID=UPI00200816B1|nr:uncharacterized protein BXZ73DRAFT_101411 [Epithele typhae]KAH9932036.1 hypothetical protein BXZ73DRAFT_101411 [Epithele typhae]